MPRLYLETEPATTTRDRARRQTYLCPVAVIPKKIHFVWSGKRFPYPFALAVRSARSIHPDWEVSLHVGVEPESPWWPEAKAAGIFRPSSPEAVLESVPQIGARLVDLHRRVPADYPAGRSNLLRLAILHAEGGWYLDCDTLCLKPLSSVASNGAVVGEEWVWKHDQERVTTGLRVGMVPSILAFSASWVAARSGLVAPNSVGERIARRLWGRPELNNAVLACEPGHSWIRRLLDLALEQDPAIRFSLGPGLVNLGWMSPGSSELPLRAAPEVFYQFPPSQTSRYFRGPVRDLPPQAVLLHWCSSNHRKLVEELTPKLVRERARRGPWYRAASALLDDQAGQSSKEPITPIEIPAVP